MLWEKIKSSKWPPVLFLVVLSGLVYLPRIGEFTFFKDDWYFIYDGYIAGPQVFLEVARHTRPIRGPLYQFLFSLFDINPFPYHLLLYVLRALGGLGAFWLFQLLWPKGRRTNLFLGLLVTIYPGFLWWTGGFEFQPYVLSFGLGILSIVSTLKAIEAGGKGQWLLWTLVSFLSGWVYLALVEYAIGMEVFRLLAIYVFVSHKTGLQGFRQVLRNALRAGAVFILIPVCFVIWYQFFFENWRGAQDAGLQLTRLLASPLNSLWAGIRLLQSSLNVSFLAWGMPLQQNFFNSRLRDLLLGLFYAAVVILLALLYDRYLHHEGDTRDGHQEFEGMPGWSGEAFWVGMLGTIGGVLPIVLVNRNISFGGSSHYALPGSLAGVVLTGAVVFSIFPLRMRRFVLAVLIGIAALTHHGAAMLSINAADEVSAFWWQIAWRAPSISTANNTTLIVLYPTVHYGDADAVAWGPANMLYQPGSYEGGPVPIPIAAPGLEPQTLTDIFRETKGSTRENLVVTYTTVTIDFRNILVLTQPTTTSCVHALDHRWPGLSTADGAYALVGSAHSNVENINPGGESPLPPAALFGPEPEHGWCYYFQKADLARQQGDWQAVAGIHEAAEAQGLHPNDQIEWLPFVQAYAYLGDMKQVKQLSTLINTQAFYKEQTCQVMKDMGSHGYPLSPEMQAHVDGLFCGGD